MRGRIAGTKCAYSRSRCGKGGRIQWRRSLLRIHCSPSDGRDAQGQDIKQWAVYRAAGRRESAGQPHDAIRSIKGEDFDSYYPDFSHAYPAVGGHPLDFSGTGRATHQCLGRIPHWGMATRWASGHTDVSFNHITADDLNSLGVDLLINTPNQVGNQLGQPNYGRYPDLSKKTS